MLYSPIFMFIQLADVSLGLLIFLGMVILVAGSVAVLAGILLVRRKVNKEVGLWIRHGRYHPEPAPKKLHF